MGIKDLYYSAEDKYYELIDKIDQHIPIHKIIEPIDNIVPSFMVVIALILIIILGLLFVLLGNGLGPEADLSFKIINEKGEPLSQITIKVSFDENTQALTTNAYGKTTKKIKVPLNSIVTYEIEETGYEKTKNSFKFTEEGEKTITLKLAEKVTPEGTKKTIRLYYEGTNELVTGKTYTVSFSCSNSSATPPATITITNGTGEVTEPADCGLLTATIRGDFTETIEAVLYDSSNAIYLEGLLQKNTLTVSVEDIDGNPLNGIKVNIDAIYENNSNPSFKDSGYTSYYGEAEFELEAGTYKITVFDEEGNYYQKTQTTEFSTDKTISFTLEEVNLTDPETGSLKITVIDADTEIVLPETKVSIYYPEGEVFEEKTTDENGMVIFFVQDNSLLYDAVLDNEQYIVKRVTELSADNQAYTIEMEKYTGNNAGKLKVRAVVIEGERIRPVRNARIALYEVNEFNEETLSGISEKITDANGYAEFTKLKNNTYKAFAYKGTASGWSDALKYDKRLQDEVELTATMIIPDGTINLQVFDQEGNRIPFATVTFYEDGTFQTIKSDKTDNNGSISFVTKADKQINFVVQAPDFLDYYSKTYPVLGNQTIEEKITMIPVTRLKTPEINFIGLFKGNEKVLDETSLESGEEYTVKLQFAVPENKNYEEAGVHFRVGNDIYMENDYLFIKKVNAGKAITTKYIMFDKDNLNDTKKSTTKGDSKWFNSIWLLPKAGVYEIEVLIKVKDNVPLGQELKLRFRGYGKTGGKYDRDPTDVSVTSATELLAETKEKTFTVGTNILCSEEFCFSATILDLKEDIIKNVTNAYPTKILQKYELSFDILNNDKTQKHYNARIQLENSDEMLNFLDYKIKNADALTRTGNANAPETPWIDLGDFDPNTHITGNTQFITQESKPGTIKITIVSNQEIVFEKEIQLEVEAPKLFRMEFEPNPVPSNTSNLVEFTVYDEETGLEVEDAQIKVLDKFRDLIAGPVLTDKIGKATLTIPGQAPDTELIFRIEKQEFEVFEQRIRIDGNIVEITPEQIGITLNTKKLTEDTYPLKIKNLLEYDLELTSLEFTGNFRRLLDERAMNAWIYTNYGNIIIPAGMTKEIQVKAILSSYGIERQERDMVDLELEFEFSNGEAVWTKTIPARISIGIGGEVDDPNCLTVERKEWKTSTEGQKVKIDFGITNSCTIDGKPIELRDLEAKINWTSNHIGTYTLTFEGQDIELRSAYYRMLSSIMQNRKYNATLAFEPLGGVNGDAIAEITVRAKNQLDGKDEFIEDKISTEIKSVNLEDCIKISPIELNIKKGETAVFGIETTGCGSNVSFTLDSEIKTSNTSITLGSQEKGPDIIVDSRDAFPGRYLIKVEAKGISLATKAQIQNVFVTVYDDACIQLSRYEFDIYDDSENEFDGYDTAQLYNYCNERDQDITINMQDWTLSMRKSLLPAVIAFGVTKALKPKTVPDAAGDGSGTGSGGTDGLGTGTTGTSNTGTSSGGTSNGGGSNNNDKDKKDGDGDDKDSDDSEGGGGIIGTVGKGASWVWNNTFGRLFGGGDKDDSDGDDDGGDDDDSGDGGGYVAPKETLPTTAFIPLPIVGELSSMLGLDNLLGSVFGGVNPFVAFGLAFVGATLYNYFSADAMDMQTTVDDITIDNIKLIEGIKYTEQKIEVLDKDIGLIIEGPFECFDSFTNTTIQCWDLTFKNKNSIVQEDEFTPIMKILKTESTKHFWESNYDSDYFNSNDSFWEKLFGGTNFDWDKGLEEKTADKEEINQYHRLQFNSWREDDTTTGKQNAYGKCSIGELTGQTGENAVPKIKLEWRWSAISEDSCDESNSKAVYCDATQFSIEVLQKITELTELLEQEKLVCDSSDCTYSTILLGNLIESTEKTRPVAGKERMEELTSFNAYLIRDGYSKDFQEDFHEYAISTAFFDTPPEYYSAQDDTGIGRYFKDHALFEFDYAGSPNEPLQDAGIYKVEIDITFNDSSWELFKGNNPNAKIIIHLDKLKAADPNSPFYYLPFDGEIGINSVNGRIGYGLDYENIKGDPIRINDGSNSIRTVPISVADPVEKLVTSFETSFKESNIDQRAKIMQFERTSGQTKLIYTPSRATPVILETTRTSENPKDHEYVFYSITVNEQPQNTGSQGITKWSGIEANCKDFLDRSSQDYMENFDIHGLSSDASYAQIPQDKTTAYGWVWPNPTKTGTFWLETLIFTPLNSQGKMHLISSSEKAKLYGPNGQTAIISKDSSASQSIELTGVTSNEITSLQKIIDLVKQEQICVGPQSDSGNSSYAFFFWNPEKVDDVIDSVKESLNAEENCITG